MKTKAAFATIALFIFVPCTLIRGLSMHMTIHSPKQCPQGLSIKSKESDGMIAFDVDVDAEEIANAGELYKGRVRASAFLNIATSEQQIAFVPLHGAAAGKRTRYQFRISPSAAKTSELQLGVHLYEKDGMATVGGGVSMQIHLAGFELERDGKTQPK